jgi:hypothetical protein
MIGLRKDLSEVLAFVRPDGLTYRTLRGALSPNVKPRGRGQFQLLRLTFAGVLLLMPGTIREIQKTRLATLALDGLSVIARTRRRVQEVLTPVSQNEPRVRDGPFANIT